MIVQILLKVKSFSNANNAFVNKNTFVRRFVKLPKPFINRMLPFFSLRRKTNCDIYEIYLAFILTLNLRKKRSKKYISSCDYLVRNKRKLLLLYTHTYHFILPYFFPIFINVFTTQYWDF